jgi:hypothetical protein
MYKKLFLGLVFLYSGFCVAQSKICTAYVFVAEECPISIFMTKSLSAISDAYINKVHFKLIFPIKTSSKKTAAAFKEKYSLGHFEILVDKNQQLAKKLGASVTPEVVVVNAGDSILYKGRINDAYLEPGKQRHQFSNNDLANALELISNNKNVPKPWKNAVGCYITFTKK